MKRLLQLFWTFFKIGLFTFGGGYAMLSLIEREAVINKKWISADELRDIIIISESTPGPIAINSATFIGYKTAGFWGSLGASLGVVLPSLIIITIISYFTSFITDNYWVGAAFKGIRCAVTVLILNAVIKLCKPALKNIFALVIAIISFTVATITNFSVIYLIIIFGVIGIIIAYIKNSGKKKEDK